MRKDRRFGTECTVQSLQGIFCLRNRGWLLSRLNLHRFESVRRKDELCLNLNRFGCLYDYCSRDLYCTGFEMLYVHIYMYI